jgi:hypothetical protein
MKSQNVFNVKIDILEFNIYTSSTKFASILQYNFVLYKF